MLHRILARSRYLMLIAVLGCFAASVTLLIYGALETVVTIGHILREARKNKIPVKLG
ncbi:YqhA family protein [Microcoleus sp. bin38.metabat.b11b12b14.051]|uniref:YqhA family protein n=1 Tax=Microcoleus sp. bin38.metabat.b11b12b14.051 TaxID=2742709 RepID=UPI0025DAB2C1|nr:YqhA family protein [Microcoleus sp. bin38.metabat.b11b12b14.051]